MLERVRIKGVIDFYRAAPVGETFFLLSAGALAASLQYRNLISATVILAGCAYSLYVIRKQFKLKRRLEESVIEHGYDERVFYKTLSNWCDRQTARVVAENRGFLDRFDSLCESNRAIMDLPYLPHL
ncbi:MAG: hypothetical protein HYW26_03180 [Candidatus Aenigmarchaeota archaeon]|nr:hypothetical protein [Candidatus Aenigmarchaeota archaeon]